LQVKKVTRYARENFARMIVTAPRRQLSNDQVCSLLFAEGTRRIFIAIDISMKDSITFEIVSRRKEAAVILGMTITFTTADDPQILLDVKLTRVN